MIEVEKVDKYYGSLPALRDASFSVSEGEVVGLLGPNGAGKTTMLRILTGYLPPSAGAAMVDGLNVTENAVRARKQIGYLPETPPLYKEMTVRGYLNFVAEIKGVPRRELRKTVDESLEMANIADVQQRLIQNISKGYRQRVGIAQAVIGKPRLLVFDEPTVGLDPKQIIEIRNLIKELGREHTVFLSSHILPEVSAVCQRIIVINKGRIVASDTQEGLKRQASAGEMAFLVVKGGGDMESAFKRMDCVESVEPKGQSDGAVAFEIKAKLDVSGFREALFAETVRNNGVILELRPIAVSLEDVFLQLTTEEQIHEGDEASPAADGGEEENPAGASKS